MTDDIVAWYLARLDEIERVALEALADSGSGEWESAIDTGDRFLVDIYGGAVAVASRVWDDGSRPIDDDVISHMALHDPRAILADVAAKRAIIAMHQCGQCATIRLLVATLARHPSYRQEWAPTERSVS